MYNTALENFFLPVLTFELDGRLKYANLAAKSLLAFNGSDSTNNKITFSNLFTVNKEEWKGIVSELMEPKAFLKPLKHKIKTCCANAFLINASFNIASEAELAEIQCVINDWETGNPGKNLLDQHSANTRHYNRVYKNLVSGIPDSLLLTFDKDFNYTFAEGESLPYFSLNKENTVGGNVLELHSPAYLECILPLYKNALEGKASTIEYKSDKDVWFYFSVAPLCTENEVDGGLVLAFNIDTFKKTERERDKKIEELWYTNNQLKIENGVRKLIERNMYEQKFELEQKNLELEQFAYVASHDLQEPLRMVSSYTQLLGNRYANKLDDEAKEFISFAVEGATRMQSLITDLLSYSRVGSREMSFEKVNLDIILQIVKRNLAILLEETEAEVKCEKYPFLQADASQLVQLFQNLISNAIKFRQSDIKPVITISAKKVGKNLRICVEDNGIGLSMEYKDRIFQIFQRLHTRDKYPGTGIGLAICKKIVERHGGQIWVESEPTIGTKFYFTIAQ
jgi:signal transduction histidine kinase